MNIICKVTAACNARCVYCSANTVLDSDEKALMSRETIGRVLDLAQKMANDEKERQKISVILHGGEPLIRDGHFLKLFIEERDVRGCMPTVGFGVQTNLTLLTPEMIPLLKNLITDKVSTSFDPIGNLRVLGGKFDYNEVFLKNLKLLTEAGFVKYGLIYVITKMSLGKEGEIYEKLRNLPGRPTIKLNAIYRSGRADFSVGQHLCLESGEFPSFIRKMYQLWGSDDGKLEFDGFGSHGMWKGCYSSGHCPLFQVGIGIDGTVYNCGRMSDSCALPFGNLSEKLLDDIVSHADRVRLLNRTVLLKDGECSSCEYWDFCKGGCPNDSFIAYGDSFRKTPRCSDIKNILDWNSKMGFNISSLG